MERTCRYCDALRQCPYLSDSVGGFVPERLITQDAQRDCDRWSPITPRQDSFRRRLCESSAFVGAMKFVHSDLPEMLMKDLILKEMEEARMQGDTPDFAVMLRQGMTTTEREEQLRHEIDDQGNIALDDSGRPIYRPCYQLKQFVTSEGSHVKLDLPVVWFWTTNQLVDHILRSEVEQGLLTKVKKQKKSEETEMAGEGRRVVVHQGGKATPPPQPQAAQPPTQGAPVMAGAPVNVQMGGPGRVATPPVRGNAPPPPPGMVGPGRPPMPGPQAVNPKIGGAQPAPAAPAAAPAPVEESGVEAVVRKVVEGCLDNLSNEIRLAIGTEVKKQLEGLRNELVQQIEAARVQMLQSVTLAYDVAVQTNGQYWYPQVDENGQHAVDANGQPQFQQAPQCWDNPDLILGLVPQGE